MVLYDIRGGCRDPLCILSSPTAPSLHVPDRRFVCPPLVVSLLRRCRLFPLLPKKHFVPVHRAVQPKPKWNQADRSTVPSTPGLIWPLSRKKEAFCLLLHFTFWKLFMEAVSHPCVSFLNTSME